VGLGPQRRRHREGGPSAAHPARGRVGATPFAALAADAIIVATSTGSTAYALSAGGPIVNPTLDAMLIAPVAPHSLFDRTVVTDLADTVTVRIADDQDGALVSTDGMDPVALGPGGTVVDPGRTAARPCRTGRARRTSSHASGGRSASAEAAAPSTVWRHPQGMASPVLRWAPAGSLAGRRTKGSRA
jgi:hypothetical protein